ncbi:zf-HC2 domain-containing protein [Streptomyces albulus]|nr:zf-HC2 domain-containing protein [Streptomyces noursei]
MSAEHDALRLALGGYVLGTLPAEEGERVRVHLAECAACRAEHARLAGLPALLATVTEAEASGRTVPTADGDLADRLVARATESVRDALSEQPAAPEVSTAPAGACWKAPPAGRGPAPQDLASATGRRRRLADAHRGSGRGTWLAAIGSVSSQATPPGPTAPAAWRTFAGSDPTTGVSASVKVSPSAWGSALQVSAKGAPAGITCRLQAVGAGGARADGATWRAGEYPPGTTIPGAVAMSPGAIDHFEILTGSGQKMVTIQA